MLNVPEIVFLNTYTYRTLHLINVMLQQRIVIFASSKTHDKTAALPLQFLNLHFKTTNVVILSPIYGATEVCISFNKSVKFMYSV